MQYSYIIIMKQRGIDIALCNIYYKEDEEEHGKTVKYHIISITVVLQYFSNFFPNILIFQHVDVGRDHIGWNLNVKSKLSVCTAIMLNNHRNPYIEITTILSDNIIVSINRNRTVNMLFPFEKFLMQTVNRA